MLSCNPNENNTENPTALDELDQQALKCSGDIQCKTQCEKWFKGQSRILNKCLSDPHNDMIIMTKVVSSMSRASWKTIKADDLKILSQFDDNLWQRYAKINDRSRIREMLLWIANTENIADHLDEKNLVLKNAFTIMGKTQADRNTDTAVLTGMKQDIDLNQHQHFFEISAEKKTESAFKAAHALLKLECNEQKICMKNFYCDLNTPIVFGTINNLELGEDIESDGELSNEECPLTN